MDRAISPLFEAVHPTAGRDLWKLPLPFLVLAGLLLLAGCAPDLGQAPQLSSAGDFSTGKTFTAPQSAWPQDLWWNAYGDPVLDGLIGEALAGAPDMKIAQARLKQAESAEQQTGATLWPTLTANASGGPTKTSLNQGFPDAFKSFLPKGWHTGGQITANLTYELDFFGKNRAALAAATSERKAAEVDFAETQLVLSTSVASTYADFLRLCADRTAAEDAVRVRTQSAALVRQRMTQQLENEGAASQADAQVATAQADLDSIDGDIARTRNALAALLGKGPDRGLAIARTSNPHLVPFGLPPKLAVDLVGRRPDIVAARLRAEAASARIDVAHADFYPNIDLSAYYGVQSFDAKDLLTKDSLIGQIGPAIRLPIFDGGAIEGRYRYARAEYDEAVATYDKTLANALHEVADAVASRRALDSELVHAHAALASGENAYRIAKLRYAGGLSRYLDVLTAEDSLLSERRAVSDLESLSFAQDVALVRALGGGFVANT